ncbi:MAG TPA: hypothetical protein VN611_12565 [Patescibacteria group bacterium]|nr:hypothetical protein [Patescibacteria group bacterium]
MMVDKEEFIQWKETIETAMDTMKRSVEDMENFIRQKGLWEDYLTWIEQEVDEEERMNKLEVSRHIG